MKSLFTNSSLLALFVSGILASCGNPEKSSEKLDGTETVTLKEVFKDDFDIGVALNHNHIHGREESAIEIIKTHFNSISPENVLKMGPVHPEQDRYNFEPADKFVAFGVNNEMSIIGHALVWHSQAPDWIYVDKNGNDVSRDTLLLRMKNHIHAVAGRYKGKIHGWDVVNEALENDGSLRQTKWLEIIGEEFIEKAFEHAKEADPNAELYYNDYNLWKPAKRDGAVRLVKSLLDKGIKVDGIGMQGHYGIDYPSVEEIEASILAFSELGVKVMITELDIDLLPNPTNRQGADVEERFEAMEGYDPYKAGLPDSVDQKLSQRYADLFQLFYKHRDKISRVTLWGVADHHSWLNSWTMPGRTNYPLLFDRNYQPKNALDAIIEIKK